MSEIIKICKRHGELTADQVRIKRDRNSHVKLCRICHREKDNRYKKKYRIELAHKWKAYKEKNKEKVKAYNKKHRDENPDLYKSYRLKSREKNAEKIDTRQICSRVGLKVEQYEAMLELQQHKCAICNKEETCKSRKKDKIKRLAVDHCHKTGKIRALLCDACNKGLGYFKDDKFLMELAIEYLIKHQECLNETMESNPTTSPA